MYHLFGRADEDNDNEPTNEELQAIEAEIALDDVHPLTDEEMQSLLGVLDQIDSFWSDDTNFWPEDVWPLGYD